MNILSNKFVNCYCEKKILTMFFFIMSDEVISSREYFWAYTAYEFSGWFVWLGMSE